ncbi:hypothetical protein U0013_13470 [Serratia marcescens subsp. marcescens ATCC 13880]|nr:hypothetical protein [Serratia marcescens]MCC3251798.1 hypothetical protein [Serratia marcescens]WQD46164.1 hypothetical protein U0013_13470 [Serratia marcescens subsp. marcescens ATCC 13880]
MFDAGLDRVQGDLVIAANEKVRGAVIGQPTARLLPGDIHKETAVRHRFSVPARQLFQTTVNYIRRAGLPAEDVNAILVRNAAALFGLQDVKRPT